MRVPSWLDSLLALLRLIATHVDAFLRRQRAKHAQEQRDAIEADPVRAAQRMFGGLRDDPADAAQAAKADADDQR